MKERSLVAFTLLAQLAVGAFWVSSALDFWAIHKNGAAAADALTDPALLAVPFFMALALLASFFHLGAPLNAWRALSNLRSSWLSREVLCAVLFTVASGTFAALEWTDLGPVALHDAVAWATALLGLALLISMAQAYRLRTVPAWDTWVTSLSFFTTALLLGGLAAGATLAFAPGQGDFVPGQGGLDRAAPSELVHSALQGIAVGAVVLLGVQLAAIRLWLTRLARQPGAAARAADKITREHSLMFRLRLALAMLGMAVAAMGLLPWGEGAGAQIAVIAAFVLALGSKALERALFYEARVRHGV